MENPEEQQIQQTGSINIKSNYVQLYPELSGVHEAELKKNIYIPQQFQDDDEKKKEENETKEQSQENDENSEISNSSSEEKMENEEVISEADIQFLDNNNGCEERFSYDHLKEQLEESFQEFNKDEKEQINFSPSLSQEKIEKIKEIVLVYGDLQKNFLTSTQQYQIEIKYQEIAGSKIGDIKINRSYSDFLALRNILLIEFPGCLIPTLPSKNIQAKLKLFNNEK